MHTVPIFFTQEEVDKFGEITGDNGPVHSVDGVVQGGFILSCLPKWLGQVEGNPVAGYEHSVSAAMKLKFRKKLPVGVAANIEFDFSGIYSKIGKINWRILDSQQVYCEGEWLVFKIKH